MVETGLYPSPYLYVGSEEFDDRHGKRVVPALRTSDATLLLLAPRVARLLRQPEVSPADLTPAQTSSLVEAGLLCSNPETVRAQAYQRIAGAVQGTRSRTLVLFPTSYCNMGCAYCGQEHTRGAFGKDHRASVLKRIRAATRSGADVVDIRWFGAEPLMAFAVVRAMSREAIDAADEEGIRYRSSIVTNGTLLDERKLRALVEECRITTFHITIDGPADIHDQHRPLKSGGRSFERLVNFLSNAVADPRYANVRFVLRTNVDVKNSDHVSEYLREMAGRGFSGRSNVTFSLVPVHPWSNDVSELEISRHDYARREVDWLREMVDLGLNHQLLPTETKPIACGAITSSTEVVGANGSVFSCTEQPLVPEHERSSALIPLTSLPPGQLRPAGQFDDWPTRVSERKVPCGTCWMLPVCGGHCPKAWADGDVPCPSMKLNMAERLSLACRTRGLVPVAQSANVGGTRTNALAAGEG